MKSIFKILFIIIITNSFLQAMEKIEISVNDKKLIVEVAKTQEEKNLGLMNRSSLGENEGMLFIFEKPKRAGFWMKNTSIPLDIAYLNAEAVVLEIYHLIPYSRNSVQSKSDQICYALEVNKDWFSKNEFKIGEKIKF